MPSRRDDSKDAKDDKKRRPVKAPKKSGVGGKGGGDDIDERGNIRGLIDYDYDSQSDSSVEMVSAPPRRKAAINAQKRIKKAVTAATQSTSDSVEKMTVRRPTFGSKTAPAGPTSAKKNLKKKVAKKRVVESESEEEEFNFDDYDDEDEDDDDEMEDDDEVEDDDDDDGDDGDDGDDDDDDDDEEDDDEKSHTIGGNLILTLGGGDDGMDRMIPQRHNIKKEPAIVQKFVKLVTTPMEDNTIDTQIDQFKALSSEKQEELLTALEKRPTMTDTGVNLMLRILTLKLPSDVQAMVLAKYNSLQNMDNSTGEYYKLRNWLDKVVSIPFGMYKELPVKLEDGQDACGDFMGRARRYLDDSIYGQDETKLQVLQYMSTKIANPGGRGMSLLLIGPPGVGKTTLIKNGISKALGWPFQFISLGGDSDASTYTGHQLVYESSHCGKIVNSLINAKSMSTIILFDEVDKISTTPKGEEVQNLLVHLTDPAANGEFEDKYLSGVPIDLSRVMFVFSANDITKIDKVLLDRLMVIDLKGYDLKQKLMIAEQYLLPNALRDVNLVEKVAVSREVLEHIIETYAKDETGVRELKRCIEQIAQKVNMLRMYNTKDLPFHIPGFSLPFVVKKEHIPLFIKKRERADVPFGMYI